VTQEDRWQSIPELNQALYQSEGLIEFKTKLPESKKIAPGTIESRFEAKDAKHLPANCTRFRKNQVQALLI
jgi:hypothetical protein